MAKKKEESPWAALGDFAIKLAKATNVKEKVAAKVAQKKKEIEKAVISGILLGIGAVFLLFAIIFLLREVYDVSYGTSTLALGIISIVLGLIMKASVK